MNLDIDHVTRLRNARLLALVGAIGCVAALAIDLMGSSVVTYSVLAIGALTFVSQFLLYSAEIRERTLVDSEDLHRRRNL